MSSHTPSSRKKSRVWKNILITSLSLNIKSLRVIGCADLRFSKDRQHGTVKFDAVTGSVYLRALSLEHKRRLGTDMREIHYAQPTNQDNLHTLSNDALHLLRDKTLNVTSFQSIVQHHAVISKARQSDTRI